MMVVLFIALAAIKFFGRSVLLAHELVRFLGPLLAQRFGGCQLQRDV
jgi:hypothetical protein